MRYYALKIDLTFFLEDSTNMAKQDTGKFRTNEKDQFYTKPAIAKLCVEKLLEWNPAVTSYRWLEPSAGSGSFFGAVPPGTELLAIDIDPKRADIKKEDFLKWIPPRSDKKTLVFGNPPFGKQSSLARKFIGKAVSISDVIAFILPRSFTKPSMQKTFPGNFHKVVEFEVPSNAFLVNDGDHDVPCIFQVWEKRLTARQVAAEAGAEGFTYVKNSDPYDLVIRRVGVNAGRAFSQAGSYAAQSHYFIRLDEAHRSKKNELARLLSEHIFPTNTTGPRSLSKHEINVVLNALIVASA